MYVSNVCVYKISFLYTLFTFVSTNSQPQLCGNYNLAEILSAFIQHTSTFQDLP